MKNVLSSRRFHSELCNDYASGFYDSQTRPIAVSYDKAASCLYVSKGTRNFHLCHLRNKIFQTINKNTIKKNLIIKFAT